MQIERNSVFFLLWQGAIVSFLFPPLDVKTIPLDHGITSIFHKKNLNANREWRKLEAVVAPLSTKSKVRWQNFLTKYISPKNYINLALSYRMHSGKRVKSQSLR